MSEREDHLAWCKQRAVEYVDDGDLASAVASMASDLSKRDDTRCPPVLLQLAMMRVIALDEPGVRQWIEGFR